MKAPFQQVSELRRRPNSHGHGPSDSVTARSEILPLAGGGQLTVHMWVLAPRLWQDLLAEHGLIVDRVEVLEAPEDDNPVSYRLFHVCKRTRDTGSPRTSSSPASTL